MSTSTVSIDINGPFNHIRSPEKTIYHKCEAVEDTRTFQLNRVNCHREGQRKVENVLQKGQLPENLDVRMGSIATISFIDGLIHNWIMFPDLLDVHKDIPAMLEGLTQMLRSSFKRSVVS
jgi:TetR/AcrR family acrAB operon transcriptional repressor